MAENEISIRISGEAGQGMHTIGISLCKIAKEAGFFAFANQDYMSRVRGGNNFFQLRIAGFSVCAMRATCDTLVALDKPSVTLHRNALSPRGSIVLDKAEYKIADADPRMIDVPFYEIARQKGGSDLFVNSVACGISTSLIGIPFAIVENILKKIFTNKEEDIIQKNIAAARAGYEYITQQYARCVVRIKNLDPNAGNLLMNGNEAIALGAIQAGCKFYSAYPMTPSTSVMDTVAQYAQRYNIVVEQAEDEIAAVNMALGASYAGVRAMTGTSGGGFALMVEGVSLAGMTETPVVIVEAQRPAPATGFPTRTEQADLEFVLHAGHGEFARAVYTPGTIEEAFSVTQTAFNTAEKYQIPVFIMTDQYLADSYRTIAPLETKKVPVVRSIISKEQSAGVKDYQRYVLTETGISPRAIPSWIADPVYADSDEHTQEGHITEDAQIRIAMVTKRFYKKMEGLSKEIIPPVAGNIEGAAVVLVGFGSTYGLLKEISDASGSKKKTGFVHLPQIWPFPAQHLQKLLRGAKKVISVENNAGAQCARLLRRETGIVADRSILKFDGRPFTVEYLLDAIAAV